MNNLTTNTIVVLAKVGDNVHQVLLSQDEMNTVLNLIGQLHQGKMKVHEQIFDSIEIGEKNA